MIKSRALVLILGFIFLLAGGGCAALGRAFVKKPKVDLDHISLAEVSLGGATAIFALRVQNPNGFSLKVDALKYDVEIGGNHVGAGTIDKPIEVAANATDIIELPVPFQYGNLFSSLLGLVKDKSTQYRVKGEAWVGSMTVPFDEKGDLKLE